MQLDKSIALVTGGNRGIGEAFVLELLAAGAKHVYIGSRDPDNAKTLVAQDPQRLSVVELDVCNPEHIKTAAEQCADINLLINNAGVFHRQSLMAAPDLQAMRDEMEVNCIAPIALTRTFASLIQANGGGGVINVLSAGGIVAVPEMGGYSPSKFAARAASNCLRAELMPMGIHLAALIVGSVKTRMAEHVQGIVQSEPREVAKAGLFALQNKIDEHDTDPHAIGIRAALARDPSGLAKRLAAGVGAS